MMGEGSRKNPKIWIFFFPSSFQNSGKKQFLSMICNLLWEALCWHKTHSQYLAHNKVAATVLIPGFESYLSRRFCMDWIYFSIALNVGCFLPFWGFQESIINLSEATVLADKSLPLTRHQTFHNVPLNFVGVSLAAAQFPWGKVNIWSTPSAVADCSSSVRLMDALWCSACFFGQNPEHFCLLLWTITAGKLSNCLAHLVSENMF